MKGVDRRVIQAIAELVVEDYLQLPQEGGTSGPGARDETSLDQVPHPRRERAASGPLPLEGRTA